MYIIIYLNSLLVKKEEHNLLTKILISVNNDACMPVTF